MGYDKMEEFVKTICAVFIRLNKQAKDNKDNKMGYISMMIYNYILHITKQNRIDINKLDACVPSDINMIYFFEYLTYNEIELLDFSKINMNDIDVHNNKDIERFVLTHIYYITQK
jgi:hypothetical protein